MAPAPNRKRAPAETAETAAAAAAAAAAAEGTFPQHILLNLPADAVSFLDALRPLQELLPPPAPGDTTSAESAPLVHCYSFSKAAEGEAQTAEAMARVREALQGEPAQLTVRSVRTVAPNKHYVCIEFRLPRAATG